MKFAVTAPLTITVVKIVDAATDAEAREIAEGLGVPRLCHACVHTGERSDDSWELSDGLNGDVDLNAIACEVTT